MAWIGILAAVLSVAAAIVLVALVPRKLVRRSQDRLAESLLAGDPSRFALLTRAEMVTGPYRRVPGVLGLTPEAVGFHGLFGESELVTTSRIRKIATGSRLGNGRRLLRLEVLRLTRIDGGELQFVLAPDSAAAWRSHLGLWAVRERAASMDTVSPGRK